MKENSRCFNSIFTIKYIFTSQRTDQNLSNLKNNRIFFKVKFNTFGFGIPKKIYFRYILETIKNNFPWDSKIGFHPKKPSSAFRLGVMYKMGPEELKIIFGFWASRLELLKQMFFFLLLQQDIWHCAKDTRLSSHCAEGLCAVLCGKRLHVCLFFGSRFRCKCFSVDSRKPLSMPG